MRHYRFIFSGWLLLVMASNSFAGEWQGIVPLHSTRAEVIKVLGSPRHLSWDNREFFDIENTTVTFTWIDPSCKRKYPIEPETSIQTNYLVFGISLQLKRPTPVTAFDLANKTLYFSDCVGSSDHRSCTFIGADIGVGYSTWQNRVTSVSYGPAQIDFKAWETSHRACFQSDSS